jgi:hypothetical protein
VGVGVRSHGAESEMQTSQYGSEIGQRVLFLSTSLRLRRALPSQLPAMVCRRLEACKTRKPPRFLDGFLPLLHDRTKPALLYFTTPHGAFDCTQHYRHPFLLGHPDWGQCLA